MRSLARRLGLGLLVLGAAAAVAEVLALVTSGGASRIALGTVWYAISATSLVGLQAAVERNLGELAGSGLRFLLALPAWLVIGLLGLGLWLIGRRERRGLS